MPLGATGTAALHVVCVLAAGAMLVQSRTARTRLAHLVMLLVMVALTVVGGAAVLIGLALVLGVAGTWLLRCRDDADAASCSLDLLANASLVALMAAGSLGTVSGGAHHVHAPVSHGTGGAAAHAGSLPVPEHVVLALAVVVLVIWAGLRVRVRHRRGRPGAAVPAWSMTLAMCAMLVA